MFLNNVLVLAVGLGVFGLVVLIVLWPSERHGQRLLRRWGVDHPRAEDVVEAVRYLKRRRLCCPWLFFLLPALTGLLGMDDADASSLWSIAWTLLLGGLLGELFALRRARTGHRQAMLARRRVLDLVPAWALVLPAIAMAGGMVRYGISRQWAALCVVVVCALVVGVIVAIAVERPAAGGPVVDLVLRAGSARVATGLAIGVPPSLPGWEATNAPMALLSLLSLVVLLAVVEPSRRVAPAVK